MKGFLMPAAALLVLATAPALAQEPAPAAPAAAGSDLNMALYDRSDTLRAVQHLFMQRSRATRGWLQGGTDILLEGAVKKVAVAARRRPPHQPERVREYYQRLDQQASQDLVVGTLLTSYGLFRLSRFGPGQYQRVVAAYLQGQPLPPYLERRLKTRYFRLLPPGGLPLGAAPRQ